MSILKMHATPHSWISHLYFTNVQLASLTAYNARSWHDFANKKPTLQIRNNIFGLSSENRLWWPDSIEKNTHSVGVSHGKRLIKLNKKICIESKSHLFQNCLNIHSNWKFIKFNYDNHICQFFNIDIHFKMTNCGKCIFRPNGFRKLFHFSIVFALRF